MIKKNRVKLAPYFVAAAAMLWGTLFLFVRKLSAAGFGAMDIVCIRAYGSVLFLFPGLFIVKKSLLKIKAKDLWCFVGTGVFSIVFFSYCYFRNVQVSSAAFASILMYTSPIWVSILSAVFFREKMTMSKAGALLMAFAGCVLVSGVAQNREEVSMYGILLGLGSGIGYGLYSIFGRKALNKGYHSMTVTAYTFLLACLGVLPFVSISSIISRFAANPMLIPVALGMAFFTTTCSFSLYTLGLEYMEPGRAAVLATLEPIITTLLGTLYYKEPLSPIMLIGIILVLIASVLICPKMSRTQ